MARQMAAVRYVDEVLTKKAPELGAEDPLSRPLSAS
jgi:hypothetical protein